LVVVVVGAWLLLAVFVLVAWSRINRHRSWRTAALLLTFGFSLAHQLLFSTVAEDAFITFRYSLNIAEGSGPVFNIGEQVEGYSNFLWMVLLALFKTVFGADIVGTAVVLGVLSTLGCVLLAYVLVNRVMGRAGGAQAPAFGVAAAVLTAGASGLAAYGPSGLETPLFLLLVLAVCFAVSENRNVVAGVLVALATMTRPDGVVIAVVVGVWLVIRAVRHRVDWWGPAGFVLGALVLAVPWTAWRVTYYGYLIPNALAAKSGASLGWQLEQGWEYVSGFALVHSGFLLLAVVAVVVFVARKPRPDTAPDPDVALARSLVWLVFTLAVVYLAFITYAGGDWMPAWRLLAPVPPLLVIGSLAAFGVVGATRTDTAPSPRPRRRWSSTLLPPVAVGLSGLSLLVSITHEQMVPRMHDWRDDIAEMAEIGDWIGDNLSAGTVLSTFANGVLSFEAGPEIIMLDVLGLTDEHIARHGQRDESASLVGHIAHDYDYVVNQRMPALAITTGSGYSDSQRCGADPVYAGRYVVATFRRAGTDNWVTVYPIREQAQRLIEALDADPRFEYVPCGE
jgi:arabinofuranosyltransferase